MADFTKEVIKEAISFHKTGDLEKAKEKYLEFLSKSPKEANAHHLLGLLGIQMNDLDLASRYLFAACSIKITPEFAGDYGICLYLQKNYSEAMEWFEKSLRLTLNIEYTKKALECAHKTANPRYIFTFSEMLYKLNTDDLELLRKLPDLALNSDDVQKAKYYLSKCIDKDNNDYIAINNLGLLYERENNYTKAKELYKKSLEINSNYSAFYNLGVLERNLNNIDESILNLKCALDIIPGSPNAVYALAMSYLKQKNFESGWPLYIEKVHKDAPFLSIPFYQETNKEKSVSIYGYGGFGDIIMFSRYAPYLKEKFKKVILSVPPELLKLFKYNFTDFTVVDDKTYLTTDFSYTFQDIPYLLDIDLSDIPFSEKYLNVDITTVGDFNTKFFSTKEKKIGLFWEGNNKSKRAMKNRSVPFNLIKKILQRDSYKFYSIQKNPQNTEDLAKNGIIDMNAHINDFYDTAAIIMNLDILITADSSPVHLSGALGKKTYLLLPFSSEWRWFNDTQSTPWYSSVEIIKQAKRDDWQGVMTELQNKLYC